MKAYLGGLEVNKKLRSEGVCVFEEAACRERVLARELG